VAEHQTRRWFADNSVSYALAAIALAEYARDHRREHFVFGPLDAEGMRQGGLVVSGEHLDDVAAVLAAIPGLAELDNGAEEPSVPIS
jgi:hypothetical protein